MAGFVSRNESSDRLLGNHMPISERRVTANGVSLWTATQGNGPPSCSATVGRPRAQVARLIPDSRHVSIDRAGHEPWVEQPEVTARAIREFLMETA